MLICPHLKPLEMKFFIRPPHQIEVIPKNCLNQVQQVSSNTFAHSETGNAAGHLTITINQNISLIYSYIPTDQQMLHCG